METHTVFDIQGYVKSMTDAGAEPRLAEAIAHGQIAYLNATVATKKDIESLRKDMTVELAKLETKLTKAIAESQFKIILSLGGLMALFGSIIAILKLL